jgi:hypothetical protein
LARDDPALYYEAVRENIMNWRRRLAAFFVIFAIAGCAAMEAGPRQAPNAPYQQSEPRDTSGMH